MSRNEEISFKYCGIPGYIVFKNDFPATNDQKNGIESGFPNDTTALSGPIGHANMTNYTAGQ